MANATDFQPTEVTIGGTRAIRAPFTAKMDTYPSEMKKAIDLVKWYVGDKKLETSGPMGVMFDSWGDSIAAAVVQPLSDQRTFAANRMLGFANVPQRRMIRFTYKGPYEGLKDAYEAIAQYLTEQGKIASPADLSKRTPFYEEYVTDPSATPSGEAVTNIYVPA